MKNIGVLTIDPWTAFDDYSLITDLTYFDELVYTIGGKEVMDKFCKITPNFENNYKAKLKDIEILERAGLIREYPEKSLLKDVKRKNEDKVWELLYDFLSISFNYLDNKDPNKASLKGFAEFLEGARLQAQIESRIKSIILNEDSESNYTPIFKGIYSDPKKIINTKASTSLNVILKKFPVVFDTNSIEKFMEFKNDPDTILKLSRLRNWVVELGEKNYSAKEIEQKIDYLLEEYKRQIEIHKLKYQLESVESIIITSLEFIENIVRLKLSKASKVLFDLNKKDLLLLEAERNFLGCELAIIHELNQKSL